MDFEKIVCNLSSFSQGDQLCPTTSPSCPKLPCGQNCLYDLVSEGSTSVKATHKTPVARCIKYMKLTIHNFLLIGTLMTWIFHLKTKEETVGWMLSQLHKYGKNLYHRLHQLGHHFMFITFRYALMDLGTNYCNLRWITKDKMQT